MKYGLIESTSDTLGCEITILKSLALTWYLGTCVAIKALYDKVNV